MGDSCSKRGGANTLEVVFGVIEAHLKTHSTVATDTTERLKIVFDIASNNWIVTSTHEKVVE